jgi:hypothetical protein
MAITTTGPNIVYERNPGNGRMRPTWAGGNFAFGDDMAEVIFSLLLEDESWNTGGRRQGPSLRSITIDSEDAPRRAAQYAEQRLQLAINDGRLRSVKATAERVRRGQISVGIEYVTRAGRSDLVTVSLGAYR